MYVKISIRHIVIASTAREKDEGILCLQLDAENGATHHYPKEQILREFLNSEVTVVGRVVVSIWLQGIRRRRRQTGQ
jgi:hypothetical protein